MKAIILGLGSMGRRRARLLHEIDSSIMIFGIDSSADRRKQAETELGIRIFESIETVCEKERPEIAFISTSPLSHSKLIRSCLMNNLHVFSELNLVADGYDDNIALANNRNRILFMSSTFLYRKEIQYIKEAVKNCHSRLSYIYHAGQYLPDWHPWESYKSFFVGDKRTNGCREFMAIEFPWIIDVFGRIKSVKSVQSRDSDLDIDFPDTYQMMVQHENGYRGLIQIDIVSRKAVRRFELSGENLYISWNGTPDSLVNYDFENKCDQAIQLYDNPENREGYSEFIIENAYKSEIENFLETILGAEKARYSFEKDKEVLSLIDNIESERE